VKIAYFDLGVTNFFEDYSIYPKNYGAGPCFARYAKEFLNKEHIFIIIGQKENFKNLRETENKSCCFGVNIEALNAIRNGYPPAKIFPELQDFDIFMHHHDCLWINPSFSKAKSVHWSLSGRADGGHPYNDLDLLYDHTQVAAWPNQKIKYIQIGKEVISEENFSPSIKEDFIFTCTRHDELMNSIEIAKNCLKYNVKGFFAGPIHNNYNLLDYIDNKTTIYLGLLDEEEKIKFSRKARIYPIFANWDIVFNQSVLEANSNGTPIFVTKRGWFKNYVKEDKNGYFYDGNNFIEIYEKSYNISQQECNLAAQQYGIKPMLESFMKGIR
jgi:Glycosyl transferases group 1